MNTYSRTNVAQPFAAIAGLGKRTPRQGGWNPWKIAALLWGLVNSVSADQFGDFTYTDDGTSVTITDYPTGATGAVEIPPTIAGKPVTFIGNSAFQGCIALTSVGIPATVSGIGDNAFTSCYGLTSVTIPPGVTNIGNFAYESCGGLTSLTISSGVTSIGTGAFTSCDALTSVLIPASVTSMGDFPFQGCRSLISISVDGNNPGYTSEEGVLFNKLKTTLIQFPQAKVGVYTIPAGVVDIASNAFRGCHELTAMDIPTSVTTIGDGAFASCSGLAELTIPPGVTSIGDSAFLNCGALTRLVIPPGAIRIGNGALGTMRPTF